MIRRVLRSAAASLALALIACGQKGPLYMPDAKQGEVVTRPASTDAATGTSTGTANSPSTPDSPGRATSPAPEVVAPATPPTDDDPAKKGKPNGPQPPPK
jgi:predicted small lipoprotein YifL